MWSKGANNGIFFFLLNQQNKIKRKVNKRKNIIKPTFEQKQTKKKMGENDLQTTCHQNGEFLCCGG